MTGSVSYTDYVLSPNTIKLIGQNSEIKTINADVNPNLFHDVRLCIAKNDIGELNKILKENQCNLGDAGLVKYLNEMSDSIVWQLSANEGIKFSKIELTDSAYVKAKNLYASDNRKALQYFTKFFEKLYKNPSKSVSKELFQFLNFSGLPLTSDGSFLAFKKVRNNYRDIYSNTVDYSVGSTVYLPRNTVDDDRYTTCSTGLHACSHTYLHAYHSHGQDDRILVVKIDPADVVAIPKEYWVNQFRTNCLTVQRELKNSEVDEYVNAAIVDSGWVTDHITYVYEKEDEIDLDYYDQYTKGCKTFNEVGREITSDIWSTASDEFKKGYIDNFKESLSKHNEFDIGFKAYENDYEYDEDPDWHLQSVEFQIGYLAARKYSC